MDVWCPAHALEVAVPVKAVAHQHRVDLQLGIRRLTIKVENGVKNGLMARIIEIIRAEYFYDIRNSVLRLQHTAQDGLLSLNILGDFRPNSS